MIIIIIIIVFLHLVRARNLNSPFKFGLRTKCFLCNPNLVQCQYQLLTGNLVVVAIVNFVVIIIITILVVFVVVVFFRCLNLSLSLMLMFVKCAIVRLPKRPKRVTLELDWLAVGWLIMIMMIIIILTNPRFMLLARAI